MEPDFPIEFIVRGTPISYQAKRPESRTQWKRQVRNASAPCLPEGHWATEDPVAVSLYYFPAESAEGDIDNIAKLVLDACSQHIFVDDRQVERLVVQKFEPHRLFQFRSSSTTLESAMTGDKPLLYVRISTDPHEELR